MKYDEKTYMEVYEVIIQNDELYEILPKDVLNYIESKAKKAKYVFEYDKSKDIIEQINRESLVLLVYLYLKYVPDDLELRHEMKNSLIVNEMKKRV